MLTALKSLAEKALDWADITGISPGISSAGGFWQSLSDTSDKALIKKGKKSWAHRCATLNAQTVSKVPLKLYIEGSTSRFPTKTPTKKQYAYLEKRLGEMGSTKAIGEITEVTQHQSLKLLEKPLPPHIDGFTFEELTHYYQQGIGNALWIPMRDGVGAVVGLAYLQPWRVTVVPDKDKFIRAYILDKNKPTQQIYESADVAHFKYPNSTNYYWGMGVLEPAIWGVDRDKSMAVYKQALWDNQARPDFLFKGPDPWSLAAKRKFLKEWDALHRAPGRAGRPAAVDGSVEMKEISFSPREVALIAEAKFDRDTICNMMGVPVSFMDISQSRAEAVAHNARYMQLTIQPLVIRFEQQLNLQYLPWFDPEGKMFFLHDNPVPEDRVFLLSEQESHLKTGFSTVNEERQEAGWDEIEGGDERLVPSNMIPAGTEAPPPVPPKGIPNLVMAQDGVSTLVEAHGQRIPLEWWTQMDTETRRAFQAGEMLEGGAQTFEEFIAPWEDAARKADEVPHGVGVPPAERKVERGMSASMRRTFQPTVSGGSPEFGQSGPDQREVKS